MNTVINLLQAKELNKYEILDTQPEVSFNNIVTLASKLLDAPYVLISFLDGDRFWFKARIGIEEQEFAAADSICSIAIKQNGICLIEDVSKNSLTKDLQICNSKYNIKFYCGVPLKNKNGITIGLLVIMDTRPRRLVEREIDVLEDLASATINQLELSLKLRISEKDNTQLTLMLAHDLKNFIGNVKASLPILIDANNNADAKVFNKLITLLQSSTNKTAEGLNQFINKFKRKEYTCDFKRCDVDLINLITNLIHKNRLNAQEKNQIIKFKTNSKNINVYIDKDCIAEALDNLINNAIKFSPLNSLIQVNIKSEPEVITIDVIDEGPGLTDNDLSKVFHIKTSLSAKPTGNEVSSGIGLWLTNQIIESHGGKLYAKNNSIGKGAKFTIELNCSAPQTNPN